jgi:hypothetical protein|tara:strand:+ start:249 stop:554 length:306 start_codon:yes stop_codon:yes gene_type:complete
MTKDNKVISILFINGMEIIGRFVSETTEQLVVYKPRMAQMSQQGVGLIPSITATGKEVSGDFVFDKRSIMYYTDTVDEMAKGWQQQTSGLITPGAKGSIIS